MKKVLVIGNGGREHALAWKFAASPQVANVYVARGNAGTALESKIINIPIPPLATAELIQFAKEQAIDLTVIGPTAPLILGAVDAFLAAGLWCLGPTQRAAQLESSQLYAKSFMEKYNIPTALYQTFDARERTAALQFLEDMGVPVVIKAVGVASDNVIIAHTPKEAIAAVDTLFSARHLGTSDNAILLEEFIPGIAIHFCILTDGETLLPLSTSLADLESNANCRMSAISPANVIDDALYQHILARIIHPTLRGIREEGLAYSGFLTVEVMVTPRGEAKVLEYHCRLGDPQAQSMLMRLESDLYSACMAACTLQLQNLTLSWDPRYALSVVMATERNGLYPNGDIITGLDTPMLEDLKIFHCGTKNQDHHIVTEGKRVLSITALADNPALAQNKVIEQLQKIDWQHKFT